jgi:4-carboxymuconolactone decarboxylase
MSPRVPYLTTETAEGDSQKVLGQLAQNGLRMHIIEAMAHSTGSIRNVLRLGNSLMQYTKLAPRHREMVILWLARKVDSSYEWAQHERFARQIGLTETEIGSLSDGAIEGDDFDDTDRLVLNVAGAVLDRAVTDEQFAALEEALGTEAAVDLVVVASWWGGALPLVISALRVEPEDGESWSA